MRPSAPCCSPRAQAGTRIVAVGERGLIVTSDDQGATWRQSQSPTSVTLTSIRFADDGKQGYAVGHAGIVLTTADAGEHWLRRLDGKRMAQLALDAARAGGDPKALKDAERLVADGADKPLLDVLMPDANHAVVVGAYGLAFATDDGGNTWHSWSARLDNPKGLHLYAIRRRGDELIVAGEQGLVLLSVDSGKTFRRVETAYKGSFFTAELPADHAIVLAGLRGNVLRSTDDGATWSPVPTPMPVSITGSLLAGDRMLMTNQAGFVLALDGGRLVPLNRAPLPPLNNLLVRRDGSLLALSVQGALPVSTK